MSSTHLTGLIAAPFTPFLPSGELNLSLIPAYYELLKTNGVSGAFISGSTGEGVSMSLEEKKQVATAWATATRHDPDFKVMCFLGGTSVTDCKELAVHAQREGLYAVSFTAPFYFKPANVEQLAACCREIASCVPDMPFYYYHIPVLTGVAFPMIDLLKAVDGTIPNFAGIKYTHEDFMDFLTCLRFRNAKYDLLWGRDENLLSALVLGTRGSVGSTFNYAAPLYHAIIQAFEQNDLETARAEQQRSIDMIRLLGKYGGIATGKAYMKKIGLDCGQFRLPIRNMSATEWESFNQDLDQLQFTTFSSRPSFLTNS